MKHITDATRLTVLKHLAKGKTPDVVAAATKLDRYQVVDIGSHHGFPHVDKMAKAVEILTRKLDREQLSTAAPTATTPAPTKRPAPPARPRPAGPASQPAGSRFVPAAPAAATPAAEHTDGDTARDPHEPRATVLTTPDELRVVVNAGKLSSSKRIQNLTTRILNDVDRLKGLLHAEEAKTKAAREAAEAKARAASEAAARKAELQARRERLESELATVKAELTGRQPVTRTNAGERRGAGAAGTPADEPAAREIRTWAREAGVECPTHGRVPARVREAFNAAHEPSSSSKGAATGEAA